MKTTTPSTLLKRVITTIFTIAVISPIVGCSTVKDPYKPTQMGALEDAQVIDGLEVLLHPDKSTARIGDLITFYIKIKNVGPTAVSIPSEPDVLLTWIYPDGKRDNFVNDAAERFGKDHTVVLKSGEQIVLKSAVTTYYFDRGGITEFRARVSMKPKIPAGLASTTHEEFSSNAFGVMFEN